MSSIVVTGEALVDLVLAADGSLAGHPGGGPYNVARAIGRLEQPVRYLGRLSDDRFGERLRRELERDGVDLAAVVATSDPTTLALAELDPAGAADYRFYAEGTSAPGLTAATLPADTAVLYAGTLGLVFEPLATTVEALVTGAGDDVLVALDPNCRPSAMTDPTGWRARLDRLLRRADVVKVSDEDLRYLEPGRDPVDAARTLSGAVTLLTRGGDGAVVVTPADAVEVPAPPVDVADTIGAGDAFMGAFLAWWHGRGLSRADLTDTARVAEAAAYACRAAAITCSRSGADPPRLRELPA